LHGVQPLYNNQKMRENKNITHIVCVLIHVMPKTMEPVTHKQTTTGHKPIESEWEAITHR